MFKTLLSKVKDNINKWKILLPSKRYFKAEDQDLNLNIKLENDETIRLYYKNNSDNIVVLTNKRFIKLEQTIITINTYLNQIISVSHHKNNIIH